MKKAACLLLLIEDKDACLETFNILVVERLNESKIGLPGGKVEENEEPIDAVIREIKEETNLDITKDQLVLVYACVCDGFYCETFGVKFKEIPNINLENLKQMEKHISPKFTKFNVNNFAIPSRFMEYNRGIIINSEDIIKTLKGE